MVFRYSGENTMLPFGDHMRKSRRGRVVLISTETMVKPAGSMLS